MSILGIISLLTGVLGVLFTILQRIWCWPFAIICTITSGIDFYYQRLYGDMALQVFYFAAGIYGWIYWQQNLKKKFDVAKTPNQMWFILAAITGIQAVVYYFLIKKFRGDQVVFDAILTACSITATYMMTKKWFENWFFWVIIDFAYVILYCVKSLWFYASLYLVFTAMAAYGFYLWRTQRSLK
jgi:nicotinamide mononucleotide transporter